MRLLAFILLLSISSVSAAAPSQAELAPPYCPPVPVKPSQRKWILEEFIQKLYIERNGTRALLDHMPEDYIQHNPFGISGRANNFETLSFVSPETVNFTIARWGLDGDIGFAHLRMERIDAERPNAVVDLFRFNGSCIQEHWDVIQEVPENVTNPLDMIV